MINGRQPSIDKTNYTQFRNLVDKARLAERASTASEAARKRKREAFQASKAESSSSRQNKTVPNTYCGRSFPGQHDSTQPGRQEQQQYSQRQGGGQYRDNQNKNVECWNCGERGHYSTSCSKPKKTGEHLGPHKAPPRGSTSGARHAAKVDARRARYNHIKAAKVEDSPEVVLGMFLIESQSALVLFDSGASHTIITRRFDVAHVL